MPKTLYKEEIMEYLYSSIKKSFTGRDEICLQDEDYIYAILPALNIRKPHFYF